MTKFNVQFTLEMGGTVIVEAKNKKEAEQKLYDMISWDDVESVKELEGYEIVHRDFYTENAEKIKGV